MSEQKSNTNNNNERKQGFVIPVDSEAVRERKRRQEKKLQEEIDKQEGKYTDGQILNFVRVRFPGHAKSFPFLFGQRNIRYGQKVVAMSDRGMAVGYINSFPYDIEFDKSMLPIKAISKVATEEDIEKEKENYKKQKETETICLRLIEKYELDMNLTHVEFTQFGKKIVFYFTAPARVDFRNLVKDLVSELKLRIELRQISVRDRSAAIGGIGPCGRLLCCSSFLDKYGNINIKMAKNQDLTLTYGKLNGVCGQLKCCINYENDVYGAKRYKLPRMGSIIKARNGDIGKVTRLHILSEMFDMITSRGVIRRYSIGQFDKHNQKDWDFKDKFDHISDETSNIIGLNEDQARRARRFEAELEELRQKDINYTEEVFTNLFGLKTFEGYDPESYDEEAEKALEDADLAESENETVSEAKIDTVASTLSYSEELQAEKEEQSNAPTSSLSYNNEPEEKQDISAAQNDDTQNKDEKQHHKGKKPYKKNFKNKKFHKNRKNKGKGKKDSNS